AVVQGLVAGTDGARPRPVAGRRDGRAARRRVAGGPRCPRRRPGRWRGRRVGHRGERPRGTADRRVRAGPPGSGDVARGRGGRLHLGGAARRPGARPRPEAGGRREHGAAAARRPGPRGHRPRGDGRGGPAHGAGPRGAPGPGRQRRRGCGHRRRAVGAPPARTAGAGPPDRPARRDRAGPRGRCPRAAGPSSAAGPSRGQPVEARRGVPACRRLRPGGDRGLAAALRRQPRGHRRRPRPAPAGPDPPRTRRPDHLAPTETWRSLM
ncbi:MAG: hypothetical protein AVDCRST_MAG36-1951, partial [uncultured Nocardioidaceae bacterium]